MTAGLPNSGIISIGNISVEILKPANSTRTLNDADVRTLLNKPSPNQLISLDDAHGKRWISPNSQTFTQSNTFTVPRYITLTVYLYAGGGGGAGGGANDGFCYGYAGGDGGAGTNSSFNGYTANGGAGGYWNTPGGRIEGNGYGNGSHVGGAGNNGGGGAGGAAGTGSTNGAAGGAGGFISKVWNHTDPGAPAWYSSLAVTVGTGGAGGERGYDGGYRTAKLGSNGENGSVIISWS